MFLQESRRWDVDTSETLAPLSWNGETLGTTSSAASQPDLALVAPWTFDMHTMVLQALYTNNFAWQQAVPAAQALGWRPCNPLVLECSKIALE